MKNLLFLLFSFSFCLVATAQSIPVGAPLIEDALRQKQLKGEGDSDVSFMVRPLQGRIAVDGRAFFNGKQSVEPVTGTTALAKQRSVFLSLLPATLTQQFTANHPYGWNDGSLIPAKGYEARITAGAFFSAGHLSVQLQPEFVYAQNASFRSVVAGQSAAFTKIYFDSFFNVVDLPERFGNGPYARLFPGQSSIRFNFKKLSLGLSTENLWWGPGVRNSLLMSNTAPGFPHISFNTTAPIKSPVGSFEGQLISGFLKSSGFLPDTNQTYNGAKLYIPKPDDERYLNGMVLTWQPKWTKGLFLGFSRVFYAYRHDIKASFDGYLPIVGKLFKSPASNEDNLKRDEILSLFFRLTMQKVQAEVYGEYGRNDHSQNMRDLMLEPEHSRAYLFGFKKIWPSAKGKDLELMAEFTSLQLPLTILLREQQWWYAHYQVRDGYTNNGQLLGAGIGPGSSSQTIGLHSLNGLAKTGAFLERVVHNNDIYYLAFTAQRDFWSHWVDYSLNVNKSWQHKRLLYAANLSLIKSLNYQWRRDNDVHFFQAKLSVSYRF